VASPNSVEAHLHIRIRMRAAEKYLWAFRSPQRATLGLSPHGAHYVHVVLKVLALGLTKRRLAFLTPRNDIPGSKVNFRLSGIDRVAAKPRGPEAAREHAR
jgi:hypothetical protein